MILSVKWEATAWPNHPARLSIDLPTITHLASTTFTPLFHYLLNSINLLATIFSLHQYFSLYCFALKLTASFMAQCDGYFFTPSVLLSPLFRTDPGCKFHSTMVVWCISGQCLLFPPASRKCTIRFCRSGASAFLRQSVHVGTLLARTHHMRIVYPIALHIVSINHSMFVHSCLWLKTHLGFM